MRTLQHLHPARAGLALLPVAAAALLFAGCASSQSPHGAATTLVPASTVPATSAPAATGPTTSAAPAAATVTASETEFRIALSQQSFTPGRITFQAINAGSTIHNLAITGPGVSATTKDLSPGEKTDLTVTLQSGSYDVFCAVDGHKQLGMDVHITVK